MERPGQPIVLSAQAAAALLVVPLIGSCGSDVEPGSGVDAQAGVDASASRDAALAPRADALAADAAIPQATYSIGTFNMAGSTVNNAGLEVADAVVRSVDNREIDFLVLNEVCENQAQRIDDELPEHDIYFDPVQRSADGPIQTCSDNGAPYGNAVLYRAGPALADEPCPTASALEEAGVSATPNDTGPGQCSFDLPTPEDIEQRRIACLRTSAPELVFCATHFTNGSASERVEARAEQAAEVAAIAASFPDRALIIGGDFNAELDVLRSLDLGFGQPGGLQEVDSPCQDSVCSVGEPTHDSGRKLDYLFVSPHVWVEWADVTFSNFSDHAPLWSDVTF
jgi:hypothetical protein